MNSRVRPFHGPTITDRHQFVQDEAALLREERLSERTGRTKAERELRELQLQLRQAKGSDADVNEAPALDFNSIALPMRPIGILRSCFNKRNGTPRQPLLVPSALSKLALRPELAPEYLDGLQQYSHCWVLFIFHENTDLHRLWQDSFAGVRAKIRVPRLNGGRLGVFATRSPHRPCPIGLSVARIVDVQGGTLTLAGADIVDGSPVLDIKPYVPFCDAVPGARTPPWVAPEAEEEPLRISEVSIPPEAQETLERCWEKRRQRSLYGSFAGYLELVSDVLSRDIRSVTQRVKVPNRMEQRVGVPTLNGALETEAEGVWHVVLDGIDISYDVESRGSGVVVVLKSAVVAD